MGFSYVFIFGRFFCDKLSQASLILRHYHHVRWLLLRTWEPKKSYRIDGLPLWSSYSNHPERSSSPSAEKNGTENRIAAFCCSFLTRTTSNNTPKLQNLYFVSQGVGCSGSTKIGKSFVSQILREQKKTQQTNKQPSPRPKPPKISIPRYHPTLTSASQPFHLRPTFEGVPRFSWGVQPRVKPHLIPRQFWQVPGELLEPQGEVGLLEQVGKVWEN